MSDRIVKIQVEAGTSGGESLERMQQSLQTIGEAGSAAAPEAAKLFEVLDDISKTDGSAALEKTQRNVEAIGEAGGDAAPEATKLAEALGELSKTGESAGLEGMQRDLQAIGEAGREAEPQAAKLTEALDELVKVDENTGALEKMQQDLQALGEAGGEAEPQAAKLAEALDELVKVDENTGALEKMQQDLQALGEAGGEAEPQAAKLAEALGEIVKVDENAGALEKTQESVRAIGEAGGEAAPEATKLAEALAELSSGAKKSAALERLQRELQAIGAAGGASAPQALELAAALQRLINEQNQAANAGQTLAGSMATVEEHVVAARNAMLALVGIAGFSDLVGNAGKTAEAWDNMNARLKIATETTDVYAIAQKNVLRISQETSSDLEATAELYTKLNGALKESGRSQEDIAALTEITNKALQAGGASAAEAASATSQFAQAMSAGALMGDEFASMAEASPAIMDALARGLGKPRTELKELASQGVLTSERVATALLSQKESIDKAYGQLPKTVGRSITNLSTSWSVFIGQLNESTATTSAVAGAIDAVSHNLDELMRVATELGTGVAFAWAIKAVVALKAYRAEVIASGAATGILAKQLRELPTSISIAVGFTGFEMGYQLGKMLMDNSTHVRQFGVAMVATAEIVGSSLKSIYESSKALFTSDTVNAAMNRNAKELQKKLAILREQFADAGESSESMGESADEAGKKAAAAATQASTGVVDLSKSFDLAKVSVDKLKETIGQAFESGGVEQLGKSLISLPPKMAAVQTAGEAIADTLKKLDGGDLIKLQEQLQLSVRSANTLGVQIDAVRTESFRRLGLDAEQVLTGIGKKSADTIGAFQALAAAGSISSSQLAQALKAAFTTVDSEKAVLSLKAEMIDLGKKGKLTGEQIAAGMLQAERALNKTHQAITPLEEALDRLGLKTKKALQFEADQAVKDLALVRAAVQRGELAVNALDTALERVAKLAQIAGLTAREEAAKTELLTRKGTEALLAQGNAGLKAGESIAAGQRIAQNEIAHTVEEMAKLKAAEQAAEVVRRNTLTPVRTVGGPNLNSLSTDELTKAAGGSDGTNGDSLQQAAFNILQQRKNAGTPGSNVFGYRRPTPAPPPPAPEPSPAPVPPPKYTPPAPAPQPVMPSAPQEVIHRIELSTPVGRSISLTADSKLDVDELLRVLTDAKSRSAV